MKRQPARSQSFAPAFASAASAGKVRPPKAGWPLVIAMVLALLQPLAGCGKKGDLEAPPGADPKAPRAPDVRDERSYRY